MYETLSRDSVNKILNLLLKTKPDTNQVKLFLSLADFYLENNDDTCDFYNNKALSLSEQLNFKYGQAKALCILGELMYRKSDSIGAAKQFDRAISISRLSGNKDLEAFIWYKMGECRNSVGHTTLVELYYQKARALYRTSGNKVNEAYLLKTIADFHFNRGKPLQSLKELFETEDIYKSAGYKKLHNTYDLIGAVYRSMGNYEEALSYAIIALNLARTTKDTSDLSLFYSR